jgi:hypothetical protein
MSRRRVGLTVMYGFSSSTKNNKVIISYSFNLKLNHQKGEPKQVYVYSDSSINPFYQPRVTVVSQITFYFNAAFNTYLITLRTRQSPMAAII